MWDPSFINKLGHGFIKSSKLQHVPIKSSTILCVILQNHPYFNVRLNNSNHPQFNAGFTKIIHILTCGSIKSSTILCVILQNHPFFNVPRYVHHSQFHVQFYKNPIIWNDNVIILLQLIYCQ